MQVLSVCYRARAWRKKVLGLYASYYDINRIIVQGDGCPFFLVYVVLAGTSMAGTSMRL